MITLPFTVELLGYWHVGSGLGRGGDADALVLRDAEGLPFLPGRAVKGLLRESLALAEEWQPARMPSGTARRLFGAEAVGYGAAAQSPAGVLRFEDARLEAGLRDWLRTREGQPHVRHLFDTVSSTALTSEGVARPRTLRTREVALPMTLVGKVTGPADPGSPDWRELLGLAAKLVRAIGSHRHRGLGRCEFRFADPLPTTSSEIPNPAP